MENISSTPSLTGRGARLRTIARGRDVAARLEASSVKKLGKVNEDETRSFKSAESPMWHRWSSWDSRQDRISLAQMNGDLAPWSSNYVHSIPGTNLKVCDSDLPFSPLRNHLEEHELPIEGLPVVKRLYMNKEFSDVKILCEDKVYHCQKCVLSCQSDVFKRMLMDNIDMTEAKSGEITIKDTSALTMESLLYYMYHDDLPKNEINGDLLIIADKFNVSDLVAICVNYLMANMNEENVVDTMIASYLTNQNELFKDAFLFLFNCRINDKKFETEAWEELKKKDPNLASIMIAEAMFDFTL